MVLAQMSHLYHYEKANRPKIITDAAKKNLRDEKRLLVDAQDLIK